MNNNNRLKKISKILSILVGFILGLLILELSLRGYGYYLANWNKFTYIKTKQTNELRILALGESMTNSGVNPYPQQLQDILSNNPKIEKEINVINGGAVGSSSRDIVKNIESYLDQYNPDIVVVMTGINEDSKVDYNQWANIKREDFLNNIKTIKLIKYLYQNLTNKLSFIIKKINISYAYADESNVEEILEYITNNIESFEDKKMKSILNEENISVSSYEEGLLKEIEFSSNKDIEFMKLSNFYAGRNQIDKVIEYALKAVLYNSSCSDAYQKLSDIQNLPSNYRERLAIKAIETNPKNAYAYIALGEIYRIFGESKKRIDTYKLGLSVIPNSFHLLYEIGKINYSSGNYKEAENYLLDALKNVDKGNTNMSDIYQILAKIYQKQNRIEEANKVLGLAIESSDVLENNYPIIADILKRRGVKLIAMQYPLRDVNILKTILKDYEVSYVDNKISFEEAIKKDGIENIFVDLFAGDFGHCTPEGNRIMANNVAEVILNNYVLEN